MAVTPENEQRTPKWYTNIDLENRYTVLNFPIFLRQRTGFNVVSNLVTTSTWVAAPNLPNDRLYAHPLLIPQRCTLDSLGIRVGGVGAAGAAARLGIYDDDGNLYPDNLILDAGVVDCTVLLWRDVPAFTVDIDPGIYWLVFVTNDGTIDFLYYDAFAILKQSDLLQGWDVAQAYGALPATFPAGAVGEECYVMRYRVNTWL